MNREREIKRVEGYPNYFISNYGELISFQNGNIALKKPSVLPYGYLQHALYKDAKCTRKSVHRLVAEAFIPNPKKLFNVDHIDEDVTNNHVSNLRWMSAIQNINRCRKNDLPVGVHRVGQKYYAQRMINGKRYTKTFVNIADAEIWYLTIHKKLKGVKNNMYMKEYMRCINE